MKNLIIFILVFIVLAGCKPNPVQTHINHKGRRNSNILENTDKGAGELRSWNEFVESQSGTLSASDYTSHKHRYFVIALKFKASDGCEHISHMQIETKHGNDVDFDLIKGYLQKWVNPHKVDIWSIEITSFRENKKRISFIDENFKACCKLKNNIITFHSDNDNLIMLDQPFMTNNHADNVPDCDSTNILQSYPCKVPIYKNGVITGYTEKSFHFQATAAYNLINYQTLSMKYKWIMFTPPKYKSWHIDNPDDHNGQYIMHLDTKLLKITSDSTAIYSPLKQK